MVLAAARALVAEGKLPVNLRIACDGEEETGGDAIVEWVAPTSAARRVRRSSTAA